MKLRMGMTDCAKTLADSSESPMVQIMSRIKEIIIRTASWTLNVRGAEHES
jgi:hypothetical protein